MSLKAIAKQLGISVTTVSRALNGYDDVSQETRARVEAEAQRRSTITFFSRWSGRSAMSWRAMTLICC